MVPHLTSIHWKRFEKFLFCLDCEFVRETRDHRVYQCRDLIRPLIIPKSKKLPLFIIRNNLRLLGVDKQDYLEILDTVDKKGSGTFSEI